MVHEIIFLVPELPRKARTMGTPVAQKRSIRAAEIVLGSIAGT